MGWRYWAVPFAGFGGWLFAIIWDIADGADDVPPWMADEGETCD